MIIYKMTFTISSCLVIIGFIIVTICIILMCKRNTTRKGTGGMKSMTVDEIIALQLESVMPQVLDDGGFYRTKSKISSKYYWVKFDGDSYLVKEEGAPLQPITLAPPQSMTGYMFLYHGTTNCYLTSIKNEGLGCGNTYLVGIYNTLYQLLKPYQYEYKNFVENFIARINSPDSRFSPISFTNDVEIAKQYGSQELVSLGEGPTLMFRALEEKKTLIIERYKDTPLPGYLEKVLEMYREMVRICKPVVLRVQVPSTTRIITYDDIHRIRPDGTFSELRGILSIVPGEVRLRDSLCYTAENIEIMANPPIPLTEWDNWDLTYPLLQLLDAAWDIYLTTYSDPDKIKAILNDEYMYDDYPMTFKDDRVIVLDDKPNRSGNLRVYYKFKNGIHSAPRLDSSTLRSVDSIKDLGDLSPSEAEIEAKTIPSGEEICVQTSSTIAMHNTIIVTPRETTYIPPNTTMQVLYKWKGLYKIAIKDGRTGWTLVDNIEHQKVVPC